MYFTLCPRSIVGINTLTANMTWCDCLLYFVIVLSINTTGTIKQQRETRMAKITVSEIDF
jgi:hypothetical protein